MKTKVIEIKDKQAKKSFFKMYNTFVNADENDLLQFMYLTDAAIDFLALKVMKLKADDKQFLDKLAKNDIYKLLNDAQNIYLDKYIFCKD